jgi:hypothetical protein
LGGSHPFFVQIAGYYLVEGKIRSIAPDALQGFVTTNFAQQADPHYNYLWSHCSENEKITLLTILALNRQKPSKKTIPNIENITRLHARAQLDVLALGKRGLLGEKDGAYSLFASSFERWISREITAPAGEEETQSSVDSWLAEGGRDKLVPVRGVLPRFKKKYWHLVGDLAKEMSLEVVAAGALELAKLLIV